MDSYEIDADYERSLGRRRLKYRIAYVGSLVAIGFVCIISFYLVDKINQAQETISALANNSSEQKVLAQRIHLLAEQLVETPDEEQPPLIDSLTREIARMKANHKALLTGDTGRGMVSNHSDVVDELLFGDSLGLDQKIRRFMSNAKNIIDTPVEFRTLDNPNLVALRGAASSSLIDGLEQILVQQKIELDEQIKTGRQGLAAMLFAVLSTLLATGLFIFNPLFKKISEQSRILFELALTDPLTGCQNRRSFMEFANKEYKRVQRHNNSTCVISIDLDDFKKINDTHGHPTGDEVIKDLVRACLSVIRATDHLGRLGGEEFAILLIETDLHNAMIVAEKVRSTFEAIETESRSGPIKCTASLGVAKIEPDDDSIQSALERADDYLYQAKEKGRNIVVGPEGV